jgi:RNA 3'-terminal phosphate cyclase-like protein
MVSWFFFLFLVFISLDCYLGTRIEINETGTTLRMKPGLLMGGTISVHDCGLSRSIGWFIEGILPLLPFCKNPVEITFLGITNDDLDLSIDLINSVTLPLLKNFGLYNINCTLKTRGMPPKGGGKVILTSIPVRDTLQSVYLIDEGIIRKVRGLAFCTRISPTIITRVVDSCRKVTNNYLADVYITTDHYQGSKDGGNSPGYSLSLVAETTTGVLLSVERTAKTRKDRKISGLSSNEEDEQENGIGLLSGESPESIGEEGAMMLLDEIYCGGVIDRMHQSLILMLMVLTSEDVSKVSFFFILLSISNLFTSCHFQVRFGQISSTAMDTLHIIREAFGVIFRIKEDRLQSSIESSSKRIKLSHSRNSDDEEDEEEAEEVAVLPSRTTFLLSCLGIGYVNVNRRVT